MEAVAKYIKVRYNTLSILSIRYHQTSPSLSENLFVSSTFSQSTASSNSSFSKFQLPQAAFLSVTQAAENSGFFKFWLPPAAVLSLTQAAKNSGFFNFWKIPASPDSSFEQFQLLQILASSGDRFVCNSGREKFWLRKILSLITVSSLQTPLTFWLKVY